MREQKHETFIGAITSWVTAPLNNYRRLRKLTHFDITSSGRSLPVSRQPSAVSESADLIWALKDVSFDVKQGEVVGIIGRNGAGKSTLLKILSRITEPTHGRALINGRVASLLEVGTGFHPDLTGRENVYLNGTILGMAKREIDNKLNEIIEFAEIEKFLDTPVKHYSSGMYVRLAFAVAAHLQPEILLVDEVLAVGDIEFQSKCMNRMENIGAAGKTVLFVSHNLLAVKRICSRAIVLRQGQIVYSGDVHSAIEHYLGRTDRNTGEISWDDPEKAPGNHQVRLKAVRITADGEVTGTPLVSKNIEIQIDYWNLEAGGRRQVSIHLLNAMNVTLLTTGNLSSSSKTRDPWVYEKYPQGLFRTSCVIPAHLLNPGKHSIDLYINSRMARDSIIVRKAVLSFDVLEVDEWRTEYTGAWLGAVRPRLAWRTERINEDHEQELKQ
jgi:lipopolysaccharide transport system ATP-binding protein